MCIYADRRKRGKLREISRVVTYLAVLLGSFVIIALAPASNAVKLIESNGALARSTSQNLTTVPIAFQAVETLNTVKRNDGHTRKKEALAGGAIISSASSDHISPNIGTDKSIPIPEAFLNRWSNRLVYLFVDIPPPL